MRRAPRGQAVRLAELTARHQGLRRRRAALLGGGLLVLGLVGSLIWLGAGTLGEPLRHLQLVPGHFQHLDPARIRVLLAPWRGRQLLGLDLMEVRTLLEGQPWVQQVRLRKRWPDILEVVIRERRPLAYWGADALVSDRLQVFRPARLPGGLPLPRFEAAVGRQHDLQDRYVELMQALGGSPLEPRVLRLDARGSWSFDTATGLEVVLGRQDLARRLARLQALEPEFIEKQLQQSVRLDLRYRNGIAVRVPPTGNTAADYDTGGG